MILPFARSPPRIVSLERLQAFPLTWPHRSSKEAHSVDPFKLAHSRAHTHTQGHAHPFVQADTDLASFGGSAMAYSSSEGYYDSEEYYDDDEGYTESEEYTDSQEYTDESDADSPECEWCGASVGYWPSGNRKRYCDLECRR